jgi:hypothetical protein
MILNSGNIYQFVYKMETDIDEIDFFLDLGNITNSSVMLFSDSDSDVKREQSRVWRRCLLIFYSTRKDVFSYFCEEKLITTFRFDRPSIEYITGIITLFNIQLHWKYSKIFLVSISGIEFDCSSFTENKEN